MTFPFGRAVLPVSRQVLWPRPLFVLGAYPSALHVAWRPPAPRWSPIKAIAVDNEPEPFWNGSDQQKRVLEWADSIGFVESRHGSVGPAGDLNGSSGRWVDDKILRPLRYERAQTWITDCLDTYRCSKGLAKRLADTYNPFARELGLPETVLPPHPAEDDIVAEANRERLLRELDSVRPNLVVTLGNAALRVFRDFVIGSARDRLPRKLSPASDSYGFAFELTVGGRGFTWLPLAHPAAPPAYQAAHDAWLGHAVSLARGIFGRATPE